MHHGNGNLDIAINELDDENIDSDKEPVKELQ